ncbi:MAG: hypothetical protein LIO91_03380 [Bacteroidales bacterium]|nr:hypothetical protein [Bacteroidales bacterium]
MTSLQETVKKLTGIETDPETAELIDALLECAKHVDLDTMGLAIKEQMKNGHLPDWLHDIAVTTSKHYKDIDAFVKENHKMQETLEELNKECANLAPELEAMTAERDQYNRWWTEQCKATEKNKALVKHLTTFIAENL